ncbi:MAG: hypothetical protein K0S39_4025 [Paenibacillus sp.]|jgi:hypothetical protein|nr:hypothetical protein [Paenibacillus sp.]
MKPKKLKLPTAELFWRAAHQRLKASTKSAVREVGKDENLPLLRK